MARPIKNNADYFPHDADMRNDTRIKALRRKFGLEGFAIYVMMIELLTDSDYFEFKNDLLSIELVAGDFDCDPDKLTSILQYCFQLDLFQLDAETKIIRCKSLDNRLNPLLSKRKRDRSDVFDNDNTQSKVKESKVKESKVDESKTLAWFTSQIDELFFEQMQFAHKGKNIEQAIKESYSHLAADKMRLRNAESSDCKKLLNTWLSNQKVFNQSQNGNHRKNTNSAELIDPNKKYVGKL